MEKHFWVNGRENKAISAVVHSPSAKPHDAMPTIIYGHGFTGNKTGDNRMGVQLARKLCQEGYQVIRFDYIGSGESEGEFATHTYFTGWVKDFQSVLAWVRTTEDIDVDLDNIGLIGHSLGGAIVSYLASIEPHIKAICTLAPVFYLEASFQQVIIGEELWALGSNGGVMKDFYNKKLSLDPYFIQDLQHYDMREIANQIQIPLCIIHGLKDQVIPFEHSSHFLQHVSSEQKDLQLYEQEEHLFSPEIHAYILNWFDEKLR